MTPSNYHLLCLPTFNVLSHTLSQPMMSSTILLPFITHLDFLHYTQLPLKQPPPAPASPTLRVLHAAPPPTSTTDGCIRFIPSTRGKPKLVHDGHSYSYHKQRTNGYILWRCDVNNKAAREKGISCNATALTTSDLPTSTLEWSRPIGVRESMKTDAVISTRMPHQS